MFESVVDDVAAYGRKQLKDGMLIIILIKEVWKLLPSSSNQVASNSFNDNYVGKYFSFEMMLHNCQREIHVRISPY
jgi:hypothetical protein